jgi:hypothetical protein
MGERSQGGTIGMKKNRLFMVGFVGIMMAAALLLSGCGEKENTDPKKIVITGLTSGQKLMVALGNDSEAVAAGAGIVSDGGSLTVDLYKFSEDLIDIITTTDGIKFEIKAGAERWTGTGSYSVSLTIVDSDFSYYLSKNKIEIKDTTTTRALTDFEESTESEE